MTEARYRAAGIDAAWPLLAELAWLMVIKPALAGRLGEARVQRDLPASRATALLGEILRREQEGDELELIALRQELSRLHAGLFDVYMAARRVRHR